MHALKKPIPVVATALMLGVGASAYGLERSCNDFRTVSSAPVNLTCTTDTLSMTTGQRPYVEAESQLGLNGTAGTALLTDRYGRIMKRVEFVGRTDFYGPEPSLFFRYRVTVSASYSGLSSPRGAFVFGNLSNR